jgi:hypothetical protein
MESAAPLLLYWFSSSYKQRGCGSPSWSLTHGGSKLPQTQHLLLRWKGDDKYAYHLLALKRACIALLIQLLACTTLQKDRTCSCGVWRLLDTFMYFTGVAVRGCTGHEQHVLFGMLVACWLLLFVLSSASVGAGQQHCQVSPQCWWAVVLVSSVDELAAMFALAFGDVAALQVAGKRSSLCSAGKAQSLWLPQFLQDGSRAMTRAALHAWRYLPHSMPSTVLACVACVHMDALLWMHVCWCVWCTIRVVCIAVC